MSEPIDHGRRNLLLAAAASLVVPSLGKAMDRGLPSFQAATGWLNSPPLDASSLRGKVVLVNFGTYTCINWLRSLPWVKAWAGKYREQGLVTVGVHTPEFVFERDLGNVQPALSRLRIEFPVAVDSDQGIWRAFNNQYWPALYLADSQGRIRHHYFGEGGYEETERMIQHVLGKPGRGLSKPDLEGISLAADWKNLKSPENYLGSARTENFASPGGKRGQDSYALPASLLLNQWALAGNWDMRRDSSVSEKAGDRLACRFQARDLHLVMSPPARDKPPLRFRVTLNGQPPGVHHGLDVDDKGMGTLHAPRLYQLIRQKQTITEQNFEIEFLDPGAQIYAFTFG